MEESDMIQRFLRAVNFVFLFGLLTFGPGYVAVSFAGESFEQMYGSELKSAPYATRVRFANDNGKPWAEATYDERYNYLNMLEQEAYAEEIARVNEETAKSQIENQKEMARSLEDAAEQNKLYAKERIKYEKQLAEERKKQAFQQKLDRQKQRIEQLRAQGEIRRR
jgi:hypothetical protein